MTETVQYAKGEQVSIMQCRRTVDVFRRMLLGPITLRRFTTPHILYGRVATRTWAEARYHTNRSMRSRSVRALARTRFDGHISLHPTSTPARTWSTQSTWTKTTRIQSCWKCGGTCVRAQATGSSNNRINRNLQLGDPGCVRIDRLWLHVACVIPHRTA